MARKALSAPVRRILFRLAEVAMPPGQLLPAPSGQTLDRLEAFLGGQSAAVGLGYEALAHLFQEWAIIFGGRPFTRLGRQTQLAYLEALHSGGFAQRLLLRSLLTPLKVAHYSDPAIFELLACPYRASAAQERIPRYLEERALDAGQLPEGEGLEAEVIVIGSGAGGAAIAAELAAMGLAVLLLEEGAFYRRADFSARPDEMMLKLYRSFGATATVGNCWIPVPLGRCVGGTTTINSGTCFRAPPWILRHWADELGLEGLAPERLDPYYAKVEAVLQVAPADPKHLGGIQQVIARGCEALGYTRHGPLRRNAPDCDGAAVCAFGCPTDAKRSTNVSYVPLALRQGATLLYNARVERLLMRGDRAEGAVICTAEGRSLTARAKAVVLAAGALLSPALLLRQRLALGSGQLGRNLSLHPALSIIGLFPEDAIDGCRSIPQGYGIEQFHQDGLLFEGIYVPPDIGAGAVTFFGQRFTEVMEAYNNLAAFGFLVEDTSRGRVHLDVRGHPLVSYLLNEHDVAQLKRGLEILVRIFFAADAQAVFPMLPGFSELHDLTDLQRLRATRLRARDFELTAHHPLGTARMGRDPSRSVVDPGHEVHGLQGLFICDGSSVPTSLGVNPQLTIMAMASRAAEFVARRAAGGYSAGAKLP